MRYKNQNIAVLGAGLSGSAAALLLRSEGAQVTVLDSAEEKNLLKSTIDNLRAQDVRVTCGAAAEEDSSTYEIAILSPGIDSASRLVRNFSSRGIDIIGELELGWRFCEKIPIIAVTGTNGKTTTTELKAAFGSGTREAAIRRAYRGGELIPAGDGLHFSSVHQSLA